MKYQASIYFYQKHFYVINTKLQNQNRSCHCLGFKAGLAGVLPILDQGFRRTKAYACVGVANT